MSERPQTGVTRKVIYTPYCMRCPLWQPKAYERKYEAAWALATHNMDAHGGTDRGEV